MTAALAPIPSDFNIVAAQAKLAHLYHKRGGGYELYVSKTADLSEGNEVYCTVANKTEAARICERHGFIRWNF